MSLDTAWKGIVKEYVKELVANDNQVETLLPCNNAGLTRDMIAQKYLSVPAHCKRPAKLSESLIRRSW